LGKFEIAVFDCREELLLADVAGLPPVVPAAVGAAAALEGGVPAEQDVGDDAERPEVAALVVRQVGLLLRDGVQVVEVVKVEDLHHLGSHVLGGTHGTLQPRGGDGLVDGGAEVEVTELDGAGRVGLEAEDVFRLQVSVSDAALVEKGQRPGEVLDDGRGLVLGEVDALLDLGEEGSAVRLLEDQVEVVLVFEEVLQLDDLQLAAAEVVQLDLLHDLGPGEGRGGLADYLDGELVAGELEDASLHPAVAALAQDLALE